MKFLKISTGVLVLVALIFFACQKNIQQANQNEPQGAAKPQPKTSLDPMTLSCGTSTGATITIHICAGASGAPAGFTIQWKTKTDYDLNGWRSDVGDSYCQASFSGVPGCSNYNLGANACADVRVGDEFDECGVSGGCGDLVCGTNYVFRAFAHNVPGGLNKSDFSANRICSTLPCGTSGCTYTQGFWKTHGPDGCRTGNNTNQWPQSVLDNGLSLDGNPAHALTADQLCSILNTSPAGGTNYALAHQLIAALLNQANGADISAAQSCITAAQTYFTTHNLGDHNDGTENTQCLTDYNEGATGPGHCSN